MDEEFNLKYKIARTKQAHNRSAEDWAIIDIFNNKLNKEIRKELKEENERDNI